jgi:predicted amidophosphoribosyltransferase
MLPIKINPKKLNADPPIEGFVQGYVLDFHTIMQTTSNDPYFYTHTQRTPLGELLYQLKYDSTQTSEQRSIIATEIVNILKTFIDDNWKSTHIPRIDCIVPSPPSIMRQIQPVQLLADMLAKKLSLPVEHALHKDGDIQSMKIIEDFEDRKIALARTVKGKSNLVEGKCILLLDDVFESGSTLRCCIDVLMKNCGAAAVLALVLTRTKSRRL